MASRIPKIARRSEKAMFGEGAGAKRMMVVTSTRGRSSEVQKRFLATLPFLKNRPPASQILLPKDLNVDAFDANIHPGVPHGVETPVYLHAYQQGGIAGGRHVPQIQVSGEAISPALLKVMDNAMKKRDPLAEVKVEVNRLGGSIFAPKKVFNTGHIISQINKNFEVTSFAPPDKLGRGAVLALGLKKDVLRRLAAQK